jgi:aspartate-semialdehyde dehydrogenase
VVGASGALGRELVAVLEERRFPASDLIPVARERSMGAEIEFAGDAYPLLTEIPRLEAADLIFLCAPPAASLELAGEALRAGVACFDLSGALAERADVPLLLADLPHAPEAVSRPLVATPVGPAAALARVLAPFAPDLLRVAVTVLSPVAGAGQSGIDSLSREVLAIFNQEEMPEPDAFDRAVAFDCLPAIGALEPDGSTASELALARDLRRLLGRSDLGVAATLVRVPTFHGEGASVGLELARPLPLEEAAARLAKCPWIVLEGDARGPTTRASVGEEAVRVGRLRADASQPAGLLLFAASDPLRLAALNAVRLAEARLARG